MGTAAGRWVIAAAVLGLGSGVPRRHRRQRRAACDRPRPARQPRRPAVGAHRLPAHARVAARARRLARRPLRATADLRQIGLVAFAATSLLCAIAPDTGSLIAARCVQGVAAALLVPEQPGDGLGVVPRRRPRSRHRRVVGPRRHRHRARARSSAGTSSTRCRGAGCSSSTCRFAATAIGIAARHVPESRDEHAGRPPRRRRQRAAHRWVSAGLVYALIEGPGHEWTPAAVALRRRRRRSPSSRSCWSRRASRTRWCRSGSSGRSSSRARTR